MSYQQLATTEEDQDVSTITKQQQQQPIVHVVEDEELAIVLHIFGLSCNNCVRKVEQLIQTYNEQEQQVQILQVQVAAPTTIQVKNKQQFEQAIQPLLAHQLQEAGFALVENPVQIMLHIGGMHCGNCSSKVNTIIYNVLAAKKVEVQSVHVELKQPQHAIVSAYLPREKVATIGEALVQAIQEAKFECSLEKLPEINNNSGKQEATQDKQEKDEETIAMQLGTTQDHEMVDIPYKKISLGVYGMSCASCVGKVEQSLNKLDGVYKATVQLLTESAMVQFDENKTNTEEILHAVTNLGFKAKLLEERSTTGENAQLTVKIDGMTCASCVATIEDRVGKMRGVKSVVVNLMTHSGQVVFDSNETGARDIVQTISSLGFGCAIKKEDDILANLANNIEVETWKFRFILSLVMCIPIVCLTMGYDLLFGDDDMDNMRSLRWQDIAACLLSIPAHFVSAWHYHKSAFKALLHGYADMNVLISLATNVAFFYSFILLVITAVNENITVGHYFFETAVMIITFQNLGKYLESIAKKKTSNSLTELLRLQAKTALLITTNKQGKQVEEQVDVDLLQKSDLVKVIAGEKIPSDGTIESGKAAINESLLTGESEHIVKSTGDQVIGGTINMDGVLMVRITRIGSETMLSQIVTLVKQAQTSKAPIQRYADSLSRIFVPVVVAISVATFITWILLANSGVLSASQLPRGTSRFLFSLLFAIDVLVVACPCALGLATPTAVMVATGVGAQLGILIKGGEPLEIAHKITTVVFDKTGTLTKGKPTVVFEEKLQAKMSKDQFLDYLGCAESGSEHPIGKSLLEHAKANISNKILMELNEKDKEMKTISGEGVQCFVAKTNELILVGTMAFLKKHHVDMSASNLGDQVMKRMTSNEELGRTIVWMALNKQCIGYFALQDTIKNESKQVVEKLHQMGIKTVILSGDKKRPVRHIAHQLGIDRSLYEVLPMQKAKFIQQLQSKGHTVAMCGDGINDSPGLAQADIGIAVGAGADVAVQSADIVLVKNDLRDVVTAIDLSRVTFRRIKWNYFWALGYNVIFIPLSAGMLYPFFGIQVPPMVAASLMILSSLVVLFSSLLLRLYKKKAL